MTRGELLDDRFEIERSVDSGGMGTVFRAHEAISGEAVAIKIGGDIMFPTMQLLRGMNLWFLGAHARAVELLESIPEADTTLGEVGPLRRILLSWLYAERGASDQARALAIEIRESCRAHHDRLGEARGAWALAEALRRSGDLEAAEREIEVARAMAMPHDHPGMLATLAEIRLAQGRPAEALAAAEDATARSTAMGGCGLFRAAAMRLAHAEALHATGDHAAARRAIADARDRLLEITDRIAEPGYQRSFLEAVPENARTLALARASLGEPADA